MTMSFLNKSVHGFNSILNGRVETGFQIVKFRHFWFFFSKIWIFLLWHFGTMMSKIFLKLQPPISLPISVTPVKTLWELSVLFGNTCAAALETNSIVNVFILKRLWSNVFFKNLPRIMSSCSSSIVFVEVFLQEIVTNWKNSWINCAFNSCWTVGQTWRCQLCLQS